MGLAPPIFHFTAAHLINPIKEHGLSLGMMPWIPMKKGIKFVRGFQWLTMNPNWKQSWCERTEFTRLPYDRNAYRITIVLPESLKTRVVLWTQFISASGMGNNPKQAELARDLNACGDPEHWLLYTGILHPRYFVAVDKNPEPTLDWSGAIPLNPPLQGPKKLP